MKVLIDGVTYIPAPQQPAESTMTPEEALRLSIVLGKEGFDYAFMYYSAFDHGKNEIKDKRFHELREQYLESRRELTAYMVECGYDPEY